MQGDTLIRWRDDFGTWNVAEMEHGQDAATFVTQLRQDSLVEEIRVYNLDMIWAKSTTWEQDKRGPRS